MKNITLNIGLAVGDNGAQNSVVHTLQALHAVGFTLEAMRVVTSDTERTVVAACPCFWGCDDMGVASAISRLAAALGQDCIAVHDGVKGALFGPQAAAWGPFNPEFFFNLDGSRLALPQQEALGLDLHG